MDFVEFPKMARLSREVFITEKLDGTNASVTITEDGQFLTGSRTRWITPEDDNYGFAKWAQENRDELLKLGVGSHFGEWWGKGIQRNYSMTERRFSLFNVSRWADDAVRPACCHVVPVLYQGQMEQFGVLLGVKAAMKRLEAEGSIAAPGFMKPEGIVIFHTAANLYFKKTLEKDEMPKGQAERMAAAAA
jgi:hypothetical protein